jgi:hypothetical protein
MRLGRIGCLPKLRRVRAYSRHTTSGAITTGTMRLGDIAALQPGTTCILVRITMVVP